MTMANKFNAEKWELYLGSSLHDSLSSKCTHLKHRNLAILKLLEQSLATSKHPKWTTAE